MGWERLLYTSMHRQGNIKGTKKKSQERHLQLHGPLIGGDLELKIKYGGRDAALQTEPLSPIQPRMTMTWRCLPASCWLAFVKVPNLWASA